MHVIPGTMNIHCVEPIDANNVHCKWYTSSDSGSFRSIRNAVNLPTVQNTTEQAPIETERAIIITAQPTTVLIT